MASKINDNWKMLLSVLEGSTGLMRILRPVEQFINAPIDKAEETRYNRETGREEGRASLSGTRCRWRCDGPTRPSTRPRPAPRR